MPPEDAAPAAAPPAIPPPAPRAPRPAASLHGFVVIDKPAGWTSFDVVARARRLLGERKIGHAGTLDPAATGVLPLAVGDATRVLEFLAVAAKTYLAEVAFGVETDSHDADGRVTAVADPSSLTADAVAAALLAFRGDILQIPPMHAAIKVDGRKLYELARRGDVIERAPRPLTVHALELCGWDAATATATLLIDSSKGFYVRALARDLGEALGVGAHLADLVRLRTGPFTLDDAVSLAEVEAAAEALPWAWPRLAVHPDAAVADWPAILLDAAAAQAWRRGSPIPAAPGTGGPVRAYDAAGSWLGVGAGNAEGAAWRPLKVVGNAA